jgi:hypothetical protein
MTEARDIAVVAAALGADGRLEPGVVTVQFDELGGIVEGRASVDERAVHGDALNLRGVSRLRTNVVNTLLTIFVGRGHGASMQRPTARAGGCFLTICILAGFPLGLALGNPMKGILIGTGVGILAAVGLWLIDSRRGA